MLSKIIAEENIQRIKKYIEKGQRFTIVTHVSPDGDALGSSLGLYNFLNCFDKERISVVVPNDFPSFLKWMPGAKDITIFEQHPEFAVQLIEEADVIFCLDFNTPKRVEKLAPYIIGAKGRKVLIDHHLNPDEMFNVIVSHPQISSTSELIFRLICRLGDFGMIDLEMAECIYTGMMTDTGAFSYNSNHPEIYLIIYELLKLGVDKDDIYRRVNHTYSEGRVRLMGYTLSQKMKVYKKYGASLICLSVDELNRYDYKTGDTEGFVNIPLSIEGVNFSVFLRRDEDYVKVSLRSVGDFPCNLFAARYFNGGGHKNASGGEFFGTLEEARELFEKALPEFYASLGIKIED